LQKELKSCAVNLGEHEQLIRAYKKAVGKTANLAAHELSLAKQKKMDLVIIFPSGPGSFAELGMFCLTDSIAAKMKIFIPPAHRRSKGFLISGPVQAALSRNAEVFYFDYSRRHQVWLKIKEIVQDTKAKKRERRLLFH